MMKRAAFIFNRKYLFFNIISFLVNALNSQNEYSPAGAKIVQQKFQIENSVHNHLTIGQGGGKL